MADITYTGHVDATVFDTATTIASPSIATSIGMLVVAITTWSSHQDQACVFTDTAGNSYTMLDRIVGDYLGFQMGYTFATAAHASNVITATWATGQTERKGIIVGTWTKDATKTWSAGTGDSKTASGSNPATDQFSTGSDETVVVVMHRDSEGVVPSSPLIAGNAADGSDSGTYESLWYSRFTSAQVNITAACTATWCNQYVIEAWPFSAVASGGSVVPAKMMHYARLRRN